MEDHVVVVELWKKKRGVVVVAVAVVMKSYKDKNSIHEYLQSRSICNFDSYPELS